MAETGEETYYIVGESRTNVDNAITKVYGSFFIAFEVIPSTGEIIQTDCSRTLELTNDFIRKLFLHKHLETDAKVIEEAIRRRYHGSCFSTMIKKPSRPKITTRTKIHSVRLKVGSTRSLNFFMIIPLFHY